MSFCWIVSFLSSHTEAVSSDILVASYSNHCIGLWHWPNFVHNLCARPKILLVMNSLCKYADDTTLIVSENTDIV
jgi:hypothetical protein